MYHYTFIDRRDDTHLYRYAYKIILTKSCVKNELVSRKYPGDDFKAKNCAVYVSLANCILIAWIIYLYIYLYKNI